MEPNETTLVEQLALLNDVEGVSNAIDSKYDGPILNNMTVTYYVAQSGGSKLTFSSQHSPALTEQKPSRRFIFPARQDLTCGDAA